ncbi:hypothetical protein ACUHMQ_14345 [Chitinimonas sp. PSY-7]|uniref:hypothetical protein n=1 Tax=Chitinimonas sp. PSY-7 TaxID=3459088 RepID=UPI0040400BBA
MSDRHAALKLHGMERKDREWILSQLEETERDRLRTYLDELEMLGIPAQPLSFQPMAENAPPVVLATAEPRDICAVFGKEPAWMLVQLLRLRSWPWERELLASLDAKRRSAILDELRQQEGYPLPPELAGTLLRACETRLVDYLRSPVATATPNQPVRKRHPLLNRVLQWLR